MLNAKWKFTIVILLALCQRNIVVGQEPNCGTPTPDSLTAWDRAFALQAQHYAHKNGILRTIPVLVHIVYAKPDDKGNISDAQIASQFPVLNNCFRGREGGVDTEIEFCLAGINRIQSPKHTDVNNGKNKALKTLIFEDPHLFLNCWVVNTIDNGSWHGFSTFPTALVDDPELDGIVISHFNFGTIGTASDSDPYHKGKVMVHEVGHWLNLYHVFDKGCEDDNDCATEGDCCCDTPPQRIERTTCNESWNSCHRDDPDLDDPIENYMGYGYDECVHEFTACQSDRMNLAMDLFRPKAWFTIGDCPSVERDLHCSFYPNPFSGSTNIRVEIVGKETPVSISVFDLQGKLVSILNEEQLLNPGTYNFLFEAQAPGMYLIHVASPWKMEWFKAVAL